MNILPFRKLVFVINIVGVFIMGSFGNGDSSTSENGGLEVCPPKVLKAPLTVPEKLLMGPGPSNCYPRVLQACSFPMLGHVWPEFLKIMDEIKEGLQYLFQTTNKWTVVISGPGHLGMEAVLANLLEPGEKVLIGVNGLWGIRAASTAERIGASVARLERDLGTAFTLEDIEQGLVAHKPKVLFLVHSESSTGVMQPLEGIGELCHKHDCLLVVDTVASMGGVPFYTDLWKIDALYTGSQKVLGAPPGMSPVTFSPRAVEKIKARTTPVKSFLLDMNELAVYWNCNDDGKPRGYHHTPPVNIMYGLREALAIVANEGLQNLWKRHEEMSLRLRAGLKAMGVELFVEDSNQRLPTVTTIKVPSEISDWKHVTQYAMDRYMIEIAGGLGATVGKVFRIGVMGYNANAEKVDMVLKAFREGLEYAKLHGRL